MNQITLKELVNIIEDGERFIIKYRFSYYETDKETFLKEYSPFKNANVISFRFSTTYNKIFIEC